MQPKLYTNILCEFIFIVITINYEIVSFCNMDALVLPCTIEDTILFIVKVNETIGIRFNIENLLHTQEQYNQCMYV